MAFPVEVSRITAGGNTTAESDHICTMPATVNVGDLLLVFLQLNHSNAAVFGTLPTGWSLLGQSQNTGINGNAVVFGKVALGNEDGTTVNFPTTSPSEFCRWEAQSVCISGWYGSLASGVAMSFNNTGGSSGNNDPPALAPSFGGEDILWYAAKFRQDLSSSDSIGYPSGYAGGLYSNNGGSSVTKQSVASATKSAAALSDDPGAFTGTAGICMTLAVRPADSRPIKGLAYDPIEGALYIIRGG